MICQRQPTCFPNFISGECRKWSGGNDFAQNAGTLEQVCKSRDSLCKRYSRFCCLKLTAMSAWGKVMVATEQIGKVMFTQLE